MTEEHPKCPRNHNRFQYYEKGDAITVDEIIDFSNVCINQFNFKGLICVSYYNEPLATKDRVIRLIEEFPDRVIVLTNGFLFDNPLSEEDELILNGVNQLWITEYKDLGLRERLKDYPKVNFNKGTMDKRTKDVVPVFNPNNNFCKRIDLELCVDYYGYGHMCCGDWKGEMYIGNIKHDNPCTFLQSWENWRSFLRSSQPWIEVDFHLIPNCCQLCLTRTHHLSQLLTGPHEQ
jgi:hypothetical protein